MYFGPCFEKTSLEVICNNFAFWGNFGPKTGFPGYAFIYGNSPALGAPMGYGIGSKCSGTRVTPMSLTRKQKIWMVPPLKLINMINDEVKTKKGYN